MIYTIENYKKEFSLKDAIISNKVDIIFGSSEELLDEALIIYPYNIKIMIRNRYRDGIEHGFTFKIINSKKYRNEPHNATPIKFDNTTHKWCVCLGSSKPKLKKAAEKQKNLSKEEIQVIESLINEVGDLILEYWKVEPMTQEGFNRLKEIEQEFISRYGK